MFTLFGFADETGDWRKDGQIFMCGYLASDEEWNRFSACWDHELRMAGLEGRGVHASELLAQSGVFFGWGEKRANDLVDRCVHVIRSTIPIGLAVGFNAQHYRTLTQGHQNKVGRPLVVCMARIIDLAVGVVGELRSRGDDIAGIALTLDDSEKDAVRMLEAWVQLKRARPDLKNYVRSVGFADDQAFYPLQAADLLANLLNRYWRPADKRTQTSDPAESHFRTLLTPHSSFPFAYRENIVTAANMDEAVRLHKRLY